MNICKRFIISGRVQGVWYRGSTQQQARRLGVKGYARNLTDGSVEVMACGPDEKIDELRNWLQQGPSNAKVDAIMAEEIEFRDLNSFETR
ncbi:MAG TPA: acylphosphatase [Candidatus Tenderia electrophaga]|uniref:acylphosphatase n=1 Tax=Candidatus Tenderia electrophaga TaxID=1748243 RepID=A0A832J3G5_9GAMM|nr:acylphosphatase [Candidatus Tenderia electrophaga]